MNTATKAAIDALVPVVAPAVHEALAGKAILGTKSEIIQGVVKEVAPVLINQANAEPWYKSRVTWGAIFAGVGGIAGLFGFGITVADQAQLADNAVEIGKAAAALISAGGAAYAWYGRWRAKKPLGA